MSTHEKKDKAVLSPALQAAYDKAERIYLDATKDNVCVMTGKPHAGHRVLGRKPGATLFEPLLKDGKEVWVNGWGNPRPAADPSGSPAEKLLSYGPPAGYEEIKVTAEDKWHKRAGAKKQARETEERLKGLGFGTPVLSKEVGAQIKSAIAATVAEAPAEEVQPAKKGLFSLG